MTVGDVVTPTKMRTAAKPSFAAATSRKSSAASLYPNRLVVLGWACLAAARVAVLATIAVYLLHPFVTAFAELTNFGAFGTFFSLGLGIHTVAVTAYIAFFEACDRFGWFQKYKVNRHEHHEDKPKHQNAAGLMKRAILKFFLYHGVVRVAEVYALWQIAQYPEPSSPLPETAAVLGHFFLAFFVGEAFNYFYHRIQHENGLLRKYHQEHHEFVESSSIAAEFSDYIELVIYTGMSFLFTSHLPMTIHFVTIMWKVAENQEVHSGYCFRGSFLSKLGLLYGYRTEFHDYHHTHREQYGNFGKPVYFDYWLRTCDQYLRDLKKQGRTALYW